MKEEEKLTFDDYASNEKIGEFIRNLRLSHNMSQSEFAKLLKVSRETITKAENGERGISLEVYKKINKLFGITFEEIIGGKIKARLSIKQALEILFNRNLFKILAFLIIYTLLLLYGSTKKTNNLYNLEFSSNNIYISNSTLTLLKNGDYTFDIKSINLSSYLEDETFDVIIKSKNNKNTKTIYKCKYSNNYCYPYYKNKTITKRVLKKNIKNLYVEIKHGEDTIKGKLKADEFITYQNLMRLDMRNDLVKYDRSRNVLLDIYKEVLTEKDILKINYNQLYKNIASKEYTKEKNDDKVIYYDNQRQLFIIVNRNMIFIYKNDKFVAEIPINQQTDNVVFNKNSFDDFEGINRIVK